MFSHKQKPESSLQREEYSLKLCQYCVRYYLQMNIHIYTLQAKRARRIEKE